MARLSLDKTFMGLYKQKQCQFELKGMKVEQNKKRRLTFYRMDNRVICLQIGTVLQEERK